MLNSSEEFSFSASRKLDEDFGAIEVGVWGTVMSSLLRSVTGSVVSFEVGSVLGSVVVSVVGTLLDTIVVSVMGAIKGPVVVSVVGVDVNDSFFLLIYFNSQFLIHSSILFYT